MMRSVFQFFSMFAAGVLTLGVLAVVLPWVLTASLVGGREPTHGLHLGSAILGLSLGLFFGVVARYHWADIPRKIVAWVLVRERQFFYYTLIAGCLLVLFFY